MLADTAICSTGTQLTRNGRGGNRPGPFGTTLAVGVLGMYSVKGYGSMEQVSVHTSKPYTTACAQRILAQVEQHVAEFAEEVLYRSGAAAVETGPALGTR